MKPEDQKFWTMEKEIKERMERLHKNKSLSMHTNAFRKELSALLSHNGME